MGPVMSDYLYAALRLGNGQIWYTPPTVIRELALLKMRVAPPSANTPSGNPPFVGGQVTA